MNIILKIVIGFFAIVGLLYVSFNIYINYNSDNLPSSIMSDVMHPKEGCSSEELSQATYGEQFKVSHMLLTCEKEEPVHRLVMFWYKDSRLVREIQTDLFTHEISSIESPTLRLKIEIDEKNNIHVQHPRGLIVPEGVFDDYSITASAIKD